MLSLIITVNNVNEEKFNNLNECLIDDNNIVPENNEFKTSFNCCYALYKNPLGSHAGINEVGAVYITIPCLPPSFASKLESIILCSLFYSKDRKAYGNEIFRPLINSLNSLQENGLQITIDNKCHNIFFILTLVIGDNLGLNSMFGFVESFSSHYYCRVCTVHSGDAKTLVKEDESLLRTREKYDKDITTPKYHETGIKEKCIFNDLKNLHCIENLSVDVMHDFYEGVSNYVTSKILLTFIIGKKYFTIDYLNYKIQTTYFDFENANKPPLISLDYLKKKQ